MSMFHLVALLAATIAARQGQAVRLSIPDGPGIERVEIRFQEKVIPYTRAGKEWFTVVGLDLDMKAGSYTGDVRVTRNSKVETQSVKIDVKAVQFPVQHLKVAEQFVELSRRNVIERYYEIGQIFSGQVFLLAFDKQNHVIGTRIIEA